jgi:hypothetical protein
MCCRARAVSSSAHIPKFSFAYLASKVQTSIHRFIVGYQRIKIIRMTRFACAFAFVAATSSVAALHIPEPLNNVVNTETMRNPVLRSKEAERKRSLQANLASLNVKPSKMLSRKLDQAAAAGDDANADAGEYNWDENRDANGLGFDIDNYSIKYTKCATVQSYSDELAAAEYTDTVLAAQRFALFRLCPKDSCDASSENGCTSNYGDYIVSLDQFLLAMMENQEQRVAGYCEYCQNCAAIEAAKHFKAEVQSAKETAVESAQTSYETWYADWLATQYANGNNVDQDGDGNVDVNLAAQAYFMSVKDSSNYANDYAANNYGGSYSSSASSAAAGNTGSYNSFNQNMWNFQNTQNKVYSSSGSWAAMGSQGGSFYGKPVVNGYYENGVFYNVYGYFSNDGTFVSLEDDDITWDQTLWGEEPDGFEDVDENTESCLYKYASSCYNQYDACMQVLEDEDYTEYQSYQAQAAAYSSAGSSYGQVQQQQRSTLKDFLGCVEVFPMEKYGNQYYQQSQYANQQSYQNANNQYNCYDGDENCQKMQEYASQMYAYQQEKQSYRRYFIGPICGSNGRDISLSVYEDEYCSVPDSTSTVESVLGYSPYFQNMNMFPTECIACLADETQAWYEDEEVYTLEPVCSMLYQYAGKCNKHLTATEYQYSGYNANANYEYQNQNQDANDNYGAYADNEWKQMYQSENQAQNENAVCNYLESLASNTYNENGEINVSGATWASWNKEFNAESKAMNAGMKAALVIMALAAMAMAVTAGVLHNVLARKNIPWKPRRSKGADPTDLARQNSGITMGRSRSGATSANPLL